MDVGLKTDFDWRIRVEVQWLNRAASIGVARAYVEAEGYRQHRYSITLLAGPDGYHVLENNLAHAYGVGAHGVMREYKDHPVPQEDVIAAAMEVVCERCDGLVRLWRSET